MEVFSAVLWIHVIATLSLVALMTVEAVALRQLGRAPGSPESAFWLDPIPGMRPLAALALLVLLLSGGFLADRASLWKLAWPKVALGIIVAFGALAGLSNRRLRQIRTAVKQDGTSSHEVARRIRAPFLKISLSIRNGLLLAAVGLMSIKPDLTVSLGIVVGLALVFWALPVLWAGRQPDPAAAAGAKLDHSVR